MVLSERMQLLPAIDLMDGQVVRLEQGKAERKTVYPNSPVDTARSWEDQGADWIHLVDLDAAFTGKMRNLAEVQKICQEVTVPCELGGGIRDLRAVEAAFHAGVSRVIIGSRACQSLDFIVQCVETWGGEKIAVGIDAKDGKVATHGWVEISEWGALELAQAVVETGVQTVIYTDIATDGMFTGPNLKAQTEMAQSVGPPQLIASGGIGTVDDLLALAEIPGVSGAIMGKALYDGKFHLGDATEKLKG